MKNTLTLLMQTNFSRIVKQVFILAVLFSFSKVSNAQTITFELLKQPCNNDGILVAHATGVTPPLYYKWYVSGMPSFADTAINSLTDTLRNYNGGSVFTESYNPHLSSVYAYGQDVGHPPFTYHIASATPAVCPALGTASISAITGGTPTFSVQWLSGSLVVGTGNSVSLPAGIYSVLVTDAAGCAYGISDSIYIENKSPVTFDVTTTAANCTDGTATVSNPAGGIAPYSYHWSNGANSPSISNLTMGQYVVTVTDAQGCSNVSNSWGTQGYVSQGINIVVNFTPSNPLCLENNGSIMSFGSGSSALPYTYLWNNGQQTQNATGLVAGYYDVTLTDGNGCISNTQGIYLNASTPITVNYSATPSSCTASTGSATLNITGGTTPYTVDWYTYPATQHGVTATALSPGNYSFRVTDKLGCERSGTVTVPPVSIISGSIYAGNAVCTQSNGSANVSASTSNPPLSYQWSNGGTNSGINNLPSGGYSCTVTDNLSCSIIKYAYVGVSSPIGIGLNATPASCIYASDGSIEATLSGGTTPYTYNWSSGATTSTATGLPTGNYSVYVSDAAGCNQSSWVNLSYDASNNSCYCTIKGKVYEDVSGNCQYDAGEPGIQNIMIHCSPLGYTFTDANGDYSFQAPSGTYTLSESVQYYYPLASCQSNSIPKTVTASSGCTTTVDFANVINPIHDISIVTTSYNSPVPGNVYAQKLVVTNEGTVTEPGIQLGYLHDGQLSFGSVIPSVFVQQNAGSYPDWYSVTGTSLALAPAASQVFDINYNVPTNIPLGTSVDLKDSVSYNAPISTSWLADYTPWNNVNQYQINVLGSFDPNFKEVMPQGVGLPGNITKKDSILNYTIHFQNTGTYPAQKVVLIDTLDSDLDIHTLKPGYSNHKYSVTMSESGVVKFTFNNINLPDSSFSQTASIGTVMYTVHPKHNLTNGTQIKSPASVYFDYNAPVRTNVALNTMNNPTGIDEQTGAQLLDFVLYPNPSTGNVTFLVNSEEATTKATVKFFDLVGQIVQSNTIRLEKGNNVLVSDVSALPAGFYFVEIDNGVQTKTQKLSVIK